VSLLPFIGTEFLAAYLSGATEVLSTHRILYFEVPNSFLTIVISQYTAVYIRKQMRALAIRIGFFATPGRVVWSAIQLGFLFGFEIANFFAPVDNYSIQQSFIPNIPFMLPTLCLATLLYVFLESGIIIWKTGALTNLEPKHFAFDSMMGFRPFGVTILRLLLSYYLFLSLSFLLSYTYGYLITDIGFFLGAAGLISFGSVSPLLAAWGLHRKMQRSKRRRVEWIDSLYHRYVRLLERATPGQHERDLVSAVANISQLRNEIHGLKEWPFDSKFVVRLAAVVTFASGVAVVAGLFLHR